MTQQLEAMKLALEVLEINLIFLRNVKPFKGQEDLASDCIAMTEEAITALRQAIAEAELVQRAEEAFERSEQAEQAQPVAWMRPDRGHVDFHAHPNYLPLYTAPPPRLPLTDEQIEELMDTYDVASIDYARAIEAVHGIKEKT